MAKDKNLIVPPSGQDFDWSLILPEGYKASDLVEIGGLTPIYIPEEALLQGFPAVFGEMDRIEHLPTQRVGEKDEWTPKCIRVVSLVATKAMGGTKDDRKLVDIKVGEDVLIPITGNLANNKKLLNAAVDLDVVSCCGFRVKGQKDIGRPKGQEMWEWQVMLHPVTKKREGRFSFPQLQTQVIDANGRQLAQNAAGAVYDPATGEVKRDPAPVAARS